MIVFISQGHNKNVIQETSVSFHLPTCAKYVASNGGAIGSNAELTWLFVLPVRVLERKTQARKSSVLYSHPLITKHETSVVTTARQVTFMALKVKSKTVQPRHADAKGERSISPARCWPRH